MVEDRVVLSDPHVRRRLVLSAAGAAIALVVIVGFLRPETPRQWVVALVLTVGIVVVALISEALSRRRRRR